MCHCGVCVCVSLFCVCLCGVCVFVLCVSLWCVFVVCVYSQHHLQEDVGMVAVNDSLLIEGSMYMVLRKHFKGTPYYTDILDLFHEVCVSMQCRTQQKKA